MRHETAGSTSAATVSSKRQARFNLFFFRLGHHETEFNMVRRELVEEGALTIVELGAEGGLSVADGQSQDDE